MDIAYLPAVAALAGSVIGGLTSFLATMLGQNEQYKAQLTLNNKMRRQDLYRDFVNEGSALYVNALTSQAPDLGKLICLYALISRMQILSSTAVYEEAKSVGRMIFNVYPEPNKNLADLRTMVREETFDPMRRFAELCRIELEGLR